MKILKPVCEWKGDKKMNGKMKAVLWGYLAGIIAGGTLVLLYTPVSGSEFRNRVKGKSKQVWEGAGHVAGKARNAVTKLREKLPLAKKEQEQEEEVPTPGSASST
jgi:gas vesicle protein